MGFFSQNNILRLFLLFLILLTTAHPSRAQEKPEVFYVSSRGETAYQAFMDFEDIKASNITKELLKENPQDPIGLFILAILTSENSGNAAKALHFLNRSIANLQKICGPQFATKNCFSWHHRILYHQVSILIDLDRNQEAYQTILEHDRRCTQHWDEDKIWPLIKMGRLEEAKQAADIFSKTADEKAKKRLPHYYCLILSEYNDRFESARACEQAVITDPNAVNHSNAHIAKMAIFDFSGAEKTVRAGLKQIDNLDGSLWENLLIQYSLEGRFSEALSAAKALAESQRRISGREAENSQSTILDAISTLLLIVGKVGEGWELAKQSHELPDRTGSVSLKKEFQYLIHLITHYAALKVSESYWREMAATLPWKEKIFYLAKAYGNQIKRILLKRKIRGRLQEKDFLIRILAPYPTYMGLYSVHLGLLSTLPEMIGRAPFQKALRISQEREKDLLEISGPYFDSLKAQGLYWEGKYQDLIPLALHSLEGLPLQEFLQKTLLKTLLAKAHEETKQVKAMKKYYEEALQESPFYFRLLGISLPVRFVLDDYPPSRQVKKILKNSPRLKSSSVGLPLSIQKTNSGLKICLLGHENSIIYCHHGKLQSTQKETGPRTPLQDLAHQFIQGLFSIKIDLSQLDINTLNGSPTKGILRIKDPIWDSKDAKKPE